jgi:hypothetical protein
MADGICRGGARGWLHHFGNCGRSPVAENCHPVCFPRGEVQAMGPEIAEPACRCPDARCHQPGHAATRSRDSALLRIPGGCLRALLGRARLAIRARVRHRPVTLLVAVVLLSFAAAVTLHVSSVSGSNVNLSSGDAAPAGEVAGPQAVGTMATRQAEPETVPTARIRDDIPGWDSIRRTPVVTNISTLEPVNRLTLVSLSLETLAVPLVLGLLAPVLGWIGFSLVIRCDHRQSGARARERCGHALLLSGLRGGAMMTFANDVTCIGGYDCTQVDPCVAADSFRREVELSISNRVHSTTLDDPVVPVGS